MKKPFSKHLVKINNCWIAIFSIMLLLPALGISDLHSAVFVDDGIQDDVKKILAVFAHPDDETIVGPMLAKYIREGVDVTLVIATDGRFGVTSWSGFTAGDDLAAARREEMQCAADALGANLYHLTYEDQFKAAEGFDGFIAQSRGFLDDLHEIMEEVQPDVVITFGADGFSNHIDHRIAGVTTTQVVLSKDWEKKPALFYAGTPSSFLDDNWKYQGTDDQFLTVRIPFEAGDLMTAKEGALCHATQFQPEFVEMWFERMQERGNTIYLRPFEAPKHSSNDLFSYPDQY
tara:strand:- start:78821 stop:79687 length:867 start_codon:yes stop_codon:yes gene_type:complete